jgi:acyl-CoA thioesterase
VAEPSPSDLGGAPARAVRAAEEPGAFDRDTAVAPLAREADGAGPGELAFSAALSPEWQAMRGPHGGYLAAILLRALIAADGEDARAPRSLTVHYARAADPGSVVIRTALERRGRSLSTFSARMEQDGALIALALAAFSVPWSAPELSELPMPRVRPPEPDLATTADIDENIERGLAPVFLRKLIVQRRIGGPLLGGSDDPMEIGAWLGLREQGRELDPIALAMLCDVGAPPPLLRLREPASASTVDLTIHFRTRLPRARSDGSGELCFGRLRTQLLHEGFFEDDGTVWAADGTVLAQSRQLALLMPRSRS